MVGRVPPGCLVCAGAALAEKQLKRIQDAAVGPHFIVKVRAGRTAMSWSPSPSPTLLRVDDELIALEADGTVLVDIDGRRRVLHGDRHRFRVDAVGRGPFRLEAANGHLVAISP